MLQEKFTQGMTYEEFLEIDTPEIKEKALKRWETIKFSSQNIEDLQNIKKGKILAYMRLSCPDCMLVLPLLEKIHQVNVNIEYSIIPIEGKEEELKEICNLEHPYVPTLIFIDENNEVSGTFIERTEGFKKRLKGLDEEDTEELVKRYRHGNYNHQVVEEIIDLLRNAIKS